MILYRCGLLSQDSHIDQLGYEKRLLVDQNGSLYTGYCTTFIPRSVIRLTDRVEKLRLFCELICSRLIAAAAETSHLEPPHSIYLASDVDIQAKIHIFHLNMNLLYRLYNIVYIFRHSMEFLGDFFDEVFSFVHIHRASLNFSFCSDF